MTFELPVVIEAVVLKAENQAEGMPVWGEQRMHLGEPRPALPSF